jgi:hypothetical protein
MFCFFGALLGFLVFSVSIFYSFSLGLSLVSVLVLSFLAVSVIFSLFFGFGLGLVLILILGFWKHAVLPLLGTSISLFGVYGLATGAPWKPFATILTVGLCLAGIYVITRVSVEGKAEL